MEMRKRILEYETVALDDENSALMIIDQTRLPFRTEILSLTTVEEIWNAIFILQVRGAPAIGVSAAIGVYLATKGVITDNVEEFYLAFIKAKEYLATARPTAVNLFWALNRMENVVKENMDKSVVEIKGLLHDEAVKIREEDIWVCKRIGEFGLELLKPQGGLLTHCNAGQLATVKYGTATAPMYLGHEKGYDFRIYVNETRPLLQGARLTAYELFETGLDVTLICDSMVSAVMGKGWIDAILVGCDRVAANGDVANKIGTSMVAIVAKRYNIPVYVCAPTSTLDLATKTGDDIEIEERSDEEVTKMWYEKPMSPEGVKVFNPSFDITDNDLITGIITEFGVARPPYDESLKEMKRMAFTQLISKSSPSNP
jgi:methylthioribose-1-phosphate isomerase